MDAQSTFLWEAPLLVYRRGLVLRMCRFRVLPILFESRTFRRLWRSQWSGTSQAHSAASFQFRYLSRTLEKLKQSSGCSGRQMGEETTTGLTALETPWIPQEVKRKAFLLRLINTVWTTGVLPQKRTRSFRGERENCLTTTIDVWKRTATTLNVLLKPHRQKYRRFAVTTSSVTSMASAEQCQTP